MDPPRGGRSARHLRLRAAIVADPLRLLLQVVVIPAATLTGVYLWKQAAIRRLLRRPPRIPAAD